MIKRKTQSESEKEGVQELAFQQLFKNREVYYKKVHNFVSVCCIKIQIKQQQQQQQKNRQWPNNFSLFIVMLNCL